MVFYVHLFGQCDHCFQDMLRTYMLPTYMHLLPTYLHAFATYLPTCICYLPTCICYLPSCICYLPTCICYLPTCICYLPTRVCYLPTCICYVHRLSMWWDAVRFRLGSYKNSLRHNYTNGYVNYLMLINIGIFETITGLLFSLSSSFQYSFNTVDSK